MKKLPLILILILGQLSSIAFEYADYDWEETPKWEESNAAHKDFDYYYHFNRKFIEYDLLNDQVSVYETRHMKMRINSDEAVEENNRIYLPKARFIDIYNIKARVIQQDGNIIELDSSKIKELENLEGYGNFKVFAIEGVEKDCDVEYFYTVHRQANFMSRFIISQDVPQEEYQFKLITPEEFVFKFKGYNGSPELSDTSYGLKNHKTLLMSDIEAFKDESYSLGDANKMRVEYKFSYNSNGSNADFFTWARLAKGMFEDYYDIDKKERKAVSKLSSKMGLEGLSDEEKIIKIENYVKNNYQTLDLAAFMAALGAGYNISIGSSNYLKDMIKNPGFASEEGIARLMVNLFKVNDIKHFIVYAGDRFSALLDEEFETYTPLDEIVIYFPNQKEYLAPNNSGLRYGTIPYEYYNNKGLKLKLIEVGEMSSGIAEFHYLDFPDKLSKDKLKVDVSFEDNFSNANLDIKRSYLGYSGIWAYPYYNDASEENRTEIEESILKLISEDIEIEESSADEFDHESSPFETWFEINGKASYRDLIENAGQDYIFNVGKLIGAQSDLYKEKERTHAIDVRFPHVIERTVSFEVPEGYEAKGLDKLNIDTHFELDGSNVIGFSSTYKVDGNKVTITIKEWYNETSYPLDFYQEFRKVINEAADFHKISIVFSPKS